METVFITIHDLSLDARIKYCSDSITEILGYRPNEVKGKSCWEYFHPDEIPFARAIHGKGLDLEKAAALNYCRIKHKNGTWVNCECVFTVVYDVLVASTAIYQRGPKAQRRAVEGAAVRRVFSSSPRDPRYHMLSYISNKFSQRVDMHAREPRAALILNRFTRTSTIMFATNGVEQILGMSATQIVGKSFYYCIAENCLSAAVRALESAKGNDSIAYLRFFFRDPNLPDPLIIEGGDSDTDESEDGGVALSPRSSVSMASATLPISNGVTGPRIAARGPDLDSMVGAPQTRDESAEVDRTRSSDSSGNSTNGNGHDSIFDASLLPARSSASSITPQETPPASDPIEIEAVVSCSSDGLVVVLRRAHPVVPQNVTAETPAYPDGLFASPWASEPILPDGLRQSTPTPDFSYRAVPEPPEADFMSAIRDVAVFAWSLTGINGSIIENVTGSGSPNGEALPPGGLPIWDPNAPAGQNDHFNGFSGSTHRPLPNAGGSAAINRSDEEITSSDDEVVWKRVPQMPAFRRPKRRAHHDAFGDDGHHSIDDGGVLVQDRRRRKLENGERQNSGQGI